MSVIDTLITDRAQSDVDRVLALIDKGSADMTSAERSEFATYMKGAYNASDLNRVGNAISYLATLISGYGYAVSVNPKTDWANTDIPTTEQMTAYLDDVAAIRAAIAQLPNTPQAPSDAENLTFAEANAIEQIMVDVEIVINRMVNSFVYSGQTYSGVVWTQIGG